MTDMENPVVAVTVNVALAACPLSPVARTVYVPGESRWIGPAMVFVPPIGIVLGGALAVADTTKPTTAFPALTTQLGDASSPGGAELRVQELSVENPGAVPVTAVPTGPELGVKVNVCRVPATTVKVALADSPTFD